jgi:hypothetical protein
MRYTLATDEETFWRTLPETLAKHHNDGLTDFLVDVLTWDATISEDHLIQVAYRPFDTRWLYWEGTTKLLDEKRAELFEQVFPGNLYLEAVRHQRKSGLYDHGVVVAHFMDLNFVDGGARCFPLYEKPKGAMLGDKGHNFRVE